MVKDISGKQIGNVPANLCKAFSIIIGKYLLKEDEGKFQWEFGETIHDIKGGAAMEYTYFFSLKNSAAEERVMKIFKDLTAWRQNSKNKMQMGRRIKNQMNCKLISGA